MPRRSIWGYQAYLLTPTPGSKYNYHSPMHEVKWSITVSTHASLHRLVYLQVNDTAIIVCNTIYKAIPDLWFLRVTYCEDNGFRSYHKRITRSIKFIIYKLYIHSTSGYIQIHPLIYLYIERCTNPYTAI